MRRLAAELGIAVMSLYNYVPAKDYLAQLMTDQLAGEYAYRRYANVAKKRGGKVRINPRRVTDDSRRCANDHDLMTKPGLHRGSGHGGHD